MKFFEQFSKTYKAFLFKMLSLRTDGQRDGLYDSNFTILVGDYKCTTNLPKACESSLFLTESGADVTYCVSGQHSYSRFPLADTNALISESPDFEYQPEDQSFRLSLRYFPVICLNTSLPFLPETSNLLQATEPRMIC
jgi:hypothetical protein